MKTALNVNLHSTTPTVPIQGGATDQDNPDADNQAILDLGELAYLAATYESLAQSGSDPALLAKTLAEFQKYASYFHINGDTITFDYNEGAETITITDPSTLAILKQLPSFSNPPSASDISNYLNNFWYATAPASGQTQTIVQQILEYLTEKGYQFQNNITNTSFVLFYLSLANVPGASVASLLDKYILSIGYYDGGAVNLGNIFAIANELCAHLANDSNLDPEVIAAGLSIPTSDPLYQVLGQYFNANYQSLIAYYKQNPPSAEDSAWLFGSMFFVNESTGNSETEKRIKAPPENEHLKEIYERMEALNKLKNHK